MRIYLNSSSSLLLQVLASAIRRGFFTCGFAPGFVPYVQPFLNRLGSTQVQFELFHLARLSFVSMVGSVFFLLSWIQEGAGRSSSCSIREVSK